MWEIYISSESASKAASAMVGTRKKILQSDILVFVEAREKTFRSTLNVTMSVTYFYMSFSFVLLKKDPSPI